MFSIRRALLLAVLLPAAGTLAQTAVNDAPGSTLSTVTQAKATSSATVQQTSLDKEEAKAATLAAAIAKVQALDAKLRANYKTHLTDLANQGLIQLNPQGGD